MEKLIFLPVFLYLNEESGAELKQTSRTFSIACHQIVAKTIRWRSALESFKFTKASYVTKIWTYALWHERGPNNGRGSNPHRCRQNGCGVEEALNYWRNEELWTLIIQYLRDFFLRIPLIAWLIESIFETEESLHSIYGIVIDTISALSPIRPTSRNRTRKILFIACAEVFNSFLG